MIAYANTLPDETPDQKMDAALRAFLEQTLSNPSHFSATELQQIDAAREAFESGQSAKSVVDEFEILELASRAAEPLSSLAYDFSGAADISLPKIRDVFLAQQPYLNSSDPTQRWSAVDAMKVLARQKFEGHKQYRSAALSVLQQVATLDPDQSVRSKAKQTITTISNLDLETMDM